jgi:hypothetical protein
MPMGPTYYVKMSDDNNLSADVEQALTYYLCHLAAFRLESIVMLCFANMETWRFKIPLWLIILSE